MSETVMTIENKVPTNWKLYTDDWNSYIYSLDSKNKNEMNEILSESVEDGLSDDSQLYEKIQIDSANTEVLSLEEVTFMIQIKDFKNLIDLNNLKNITKIIGWLISDYNITSDTYKFYITVIECVCNVIKYFIKKLKFPEHQLQKDFSFYKLL